MAKPKKTERPCATCAGVGTVPVTPRRAEPGSYPVCTTCGERCPSCLQRIAFGPPAASRDRCDSCDGSGHVITDDERRARELERFEETERVIEESLRLLRQLGVA